MPYVLSIASAFVAVILAPVAVLLSAPVGDGPVLVIVPAGRDAAGVLARANQDQIGPSSAPFAVIASGGAGARAHLLRAGAWAVTDANKVGAFCGVSGDGG